MYSTPDHLPQIATIYEIRIGGHLGPQWSSWFEGMSIQLEPNGDTLLTGPLVDQSALYGLLRKIRDVGMPLRSLNPLAETGNPNPLSENI